MIGCIATACLTVCLLGHLTDVTERKSSRYKYVDFFNEEEDFEVLFMGTSHVRNGIFPMELWNDYGIVSYNLGGHGNRGATTYWTLQNALDYTNPKVVVIDCLFFTGGGKTDKNFSNVHLSLDGFPTTLTKVRAIWDLLDDEALDEEIASGRWSESDTGTEPRTKIGLLWDYSVYHSRWNQLTSSDFSPGKNLEKGAESRIAVTPGTFEKITSYSDVDNGTVGEEYFRKMIEDCQRRGIEVLLTYLPFPAGEGSQNDANYVNEIAEEYGINYINFLDLNVVNYKTDCYDKNSHLNPSGARKVSNYLGQYLTQNYDVGNQKNNKVYADWNEDYIAYCDMKDKNFRNNEDLYQYLMLLSDDDVEIVMDVRDKTIFQNDLALELLQNIGAEKDSLNENTDFIIIRNRGTEVAVLDNFRNDGAQINIDGHNYNLSYDISGENHEGKTGYFCVYKDDELLVENNAEDDTSLDISVFRDNERIDNAKFTYKVEHGYKRKKL